MAPLNSTKSSLDRDPQGPKLSSTMGRNQRRIPCMSQNCAPSPSRSNPLPTGTLHEVIPLHYSTECAIQARKASTFAASLFHGRDDRGDERLVRVIRCFGISSPRRFGCRFEFARLFARLSVLRCNQLLCVLLLSPHNLTRRRIRYLVHTHTTHVSACSFLRGRVRQANRRRSSTST